MHALTRGRVLPSPLGDVVVQQDAENLRESLKLIYKSAQPIGQTLPPFAEAVRAHNKVRGSTERAPWVGCALTFAWRGVRAYVCRRILQTVQAFVDNLEQGQPTDSLRSAMANTVRLQECLVGGMEDMIKALDTLVIQPQQNFVKKDVRDARYFSHEFLKVRARPHAHARQSTAHAHAGPGRFHGRLGGGGCAHRPRSTMRLPSRA